MKCQYKKCPNPISKTSKIFCEKHLIERRIYYREIRSKRKSKGVCIFCMEEVNNRVVCVECQRKNYYRDIENSRKTRREYHRKNREKINILTLERERRRKFGGLYHIVMKRDNYTCQQCGITDNLSIHHKDGNGSNSKNPNNTLDNLIVMCSSCHGFLHRSMQKFEKNLGKVITCSECNNISKLWNKNHNCCRNCYKKNHMYKNRKLF